MGGNMQAMTSSVVGIPALSARRISKKTGATQKFAAPALRVKSQRSTKLVCKANMEKKAAAVSTAVSTALVTASPALALVDERMNGDGVGYMLGINDGVILGPMLLAFFAVFGAYLSVSDAKWGDKDDDES